VTRFGEFISIDRNRCTGSGMCTVHAPDTFDVGDDARAVLLPGPTDDIASIRAAIEGCPTGALQLLGDSRNES